MTASHRGAFLRYEPLFVEAGTANGVSPALLAAVAWQESKFDPNAHNDGGDVGIMQFQPGTAHDYGVTDRTNPQQEIPAAAKKLAGELRLYNGSIPLALAAYNAGEGNVAKYGGIPAFSKTKAYVKEITHNLEKGSAS